MSSSPVDNNDSTHPTVSVIVPVYNTEPYLRDSIDSILSQTEKNLEVILVDDGSTDGSSEICDTYASSDQRVSVFHRKNSGVSSSRNFGVDRARGSYILFVDADDCISPHMLNLLLSSMSPKEDMAICGYASFRDGDDAVIRTVGEGEVPARAISPAEALQEMLYEEIITTSPWAKLFHRDLFDGIRFPDIKTAEDLAIMYLLIGKATSVSRVDLPLYGYRIRSGSAIRNIFSPERLHGLEHAFTMLGYVRENFPGIEKSAVNRYFMEAVYILQNMSVRNVLTDSGPYRRCSRAVHGSRTTVLLDRRARPRHRIYAALSYPGCWTLVLTGDVLRLVQRIRQLRHRDDA